ncbi:transglycosylase domain-containing protein [Sphingomonas montanisoli]|uniref:Penicillin-binding protein n=1 Tax=Sphingomonas montanisoli TaxID=2606412 RepID=A0A5D9CCH6_9SPHN|nr:transglycosylase domain-containing protein [Sphingomonas montanisoli]TZG27795.1 penicillin-binding protein [Sphingomonas montanisoli]
MPKADAPTPDPNGGDETAAPTAPWQQRLRDGLRGLPWWRIGKWTGIAFAGLFVFAILWACWIAPPWGNMQPPRKPSFLYLSSDGTPIARRGTREAPVDAATLPVQVKGAFIAIEDRRFASHMGVDPRGLIRAFWRNMRAGGVVQGGSTITQQLAKTDFLTSDRKIGRKLQEFVLALWLDAWLSKDEILSRYLSSIYFGDGAYGLRAAAHHYFRKEPEKLNAAQAAMLAGMVKAPSRLNPVGNLDGAQARSKLVLAAMAEEGMITPEELARTRPARPNVATDELPAGTYFVDWVAPQIEDRANEGEGQITVRTTLDRDLQKAAVRSLTSILSRWGDGVHATQAALVAMTPDGRVVAMIGGRSYRASPFNRATQAKRQPGSAFKLAVYLTAMERGYSPDSMVDNSRLTIDGWEPHNYGNRYGGPITMRSAFAQSSNVAAVRVAEMVGRSNVADAARRLGIGSELASGPSMALGVSGTTLIELTAAYAAIAGGRYPVAASGLAESRQAQVAQFDPVTREKVLDLLWSATNQGTGRAAALGIPTFGKTGTTQNHRDAVYVGFAGGLVTGIWVGNDDNSAMRGVTGGQLPAEIWRSFMSNAHLREADLQVPERLRVAIEQRQEAMRLAAEQRALEALEALEDEQRSPFERFIEGLLPRFLGGGDRDEPRDERERPREDDPFNGE